jgi:hypothetical protein
VSTAVLAVAAVVAGVFSWRALRDGQDQLRILSEQEADRRADLTRAVNGWVARIAKHDGKWTAWVTIQNRSKAPVFDCWVYLFPEAWHEHQLVECFPSLGPDEVRVLDFVNLNDENVMSIGVAVEFRDATERRWVRSAKGKLEPFSGEPGTAYPLTT